MYVLIVRATINAMHHWPDAPDKRAYLRYPHRHSFSVVANIPVRGANRELELHDLQEELSELLMDIAEKNPETDQWDFGSMSCEQIGDAILGEMPSIMNVSVMEDDMHGGLAFRDNSRETVTVCGSTKFKTETLEAIAMLEKRGDVVLSVGSFMHADAVDVSPEEKLKFDKLHMDKIRMSHYIYVIDPNGYIGESTRREIDFAEGLGLRVEYMPRRILPLIPVENSEEIRGRKSITKFNEAMEHKLAVNDFKGGWESLTLDHLFRRLQDEVMELHVALQDEGAMSKEIINECADVANFAMMISDNLQRGK